jgi:hypothetical protein
MLRKTSCFLALVLLCGIGRAGISLADEPRFIARLPQGTVELLGVTDGYRPTKESRWWRPDGSNMSIGSFRALQKYPQRKLVADDKFRTFLVGIENLPADASQDPVGGVNPSTTPEGPLRGAPNWIAGEGSTAKDPTQYFTGSPLWGGGTYGHLWVATSVYYGVEVQKAPVRGGTRPSKRAPTNPATAYPDQNIVPRFYRMFAGTFAESSHATDLRIGVSMGAWETVTTRIPTSAGKQIFSRDGREWSVVFDKPRAILHRTATEVKLKSSSHTYGQWNKRLVAVADDGSEHASSIGVDLDGDYGVAVFYDLPLSSIKEFQLQVRSFHCVEFDNISLQPGQKTAVKVISSEAPESTDK